MERMNRKDSSMSALSYHTDNDGESDRVSEAGDCGDRALPSRRFSESNSSSIHSSDNWSEENETAVLIAEEEILHPYSTLSTGAIVGSEDTNHEHHRGLLKLLDYASCMAHLAVFGIFGVICLTIGLGFLRCTYDGIIAALVFLWCSVNVSQFMHYIP